VLVVAVAVVDVERRTIVVVAAVVQALELRASTKHHLSAPPRQSQ
jgi:hypothetical protein